MSSATQSTNSCGSVERNGSGERPALKIVILFETVRAGERARLKVERLLSGMQVAPEVETDLWGFEDASRPELREQAGAQAREADIILLSAEGDGLSAPILDLVERWLPRKSARPAALVALLGENSPAPGQLPGAGEYLRQKAQAAGLDFFCEIAPGRGQGWDSGSRSILDRPGGDSQITWVDSHEADGYRGYGIND
jgi:hypothetical protein